MQTRLFLILCLLSLQIFTSAQVRVAVQGGYQSTSARYTIEDSKQSTGNKSGVVGGLSLKVPFENQLYFFPTVQYSKKGYTVDFTEKAFPPSKIAINNNTTIHAIDFAPLLQLDFSKNPSHLFIRFGPSFDFVVSGTESFDTLNASGNPGNVTQEMLFSFGDYGRISASVAGHLGYETAGGFMIFAHYNFGIGSMNNADYGPRILHRIAGISVGYLLGKRKKIS
jgi:hypothetical protein